MLSHTILNCLCCQAASGTITCYLCKASHKSRLV